MNTIGNEVLLGALNWRYATKAFDSTRKIPTETWATLEKALILSPSSFGLQPYRFLVITDLKVREQLVPHTWGQRQVVDCSQFVVFTARTQITVEEVEKHIQLSAATRGIAVEALKGYRDLMVGDLVNGPRSEIIPEWTARQAYIAIGNLMTSAALLGVDTCPIEGFIPHKYDEILNLKPAGYRAVVACACGYRAATDNYARFAKVRHPESELIQRV
jgi:nitroreductase